ncbi:MAG: ATP-binding protein [Clostridia bacterium]|nr:ATP-binding protein [Clostridia bacterium]
MIQKLFRRMLLTQILSAMTVTLCMLIDSIMIGRFLGVDSMSAYGLASPLLLIFAAFGSLISAGVQVVCGKTIGRGDREGTNACFSVSIFLAAAISAVGLALVLSLLDPLTCLLGAGNPGPDNPVFGLTREYIVGFILGAPAFLLAQIMVPYMQIAGARMRLVAAVAAMTVSDVVFDFLSVFVFNGGTFGMGLASTLSYYVAVAVGVGCFLKKDSIFRFRRKLIGMRVVRELAAYGVPTVINQISMVLQVFLFNRLLLSVDGTRAVAACSVILTVGNICFCVGSGAGAVAMMLSAIFYADQDRTSIRQLVGIMTKYAVLLDIGVTAVCLLAAPLLIALFLDPASGARAIAVTGLRLFALSLLPSSINSSFKNYYQGVNRLRLAEMISVLQNLVFPVLFAFLLSRTLGVNGVFLGFVTGETATLLFFSLFVWKHHGGISFSADAYSMLEPGFGADEDHSFERTVRSLEEAAEVSRQLGDFCREKGLDRRTSNLIALCVEEMTVNVVRHGFTKDKRSHSIDVRFVLGEGRRVIRIRDDCPGFDPTEYLKLHQADDPASHIGLRMVMSMVKEADYVNSLGLNSVSLVI